MTDKHSKGCVYVIERKTVEGEQRKIGKTSSEDPTRRLAEINGSGCDPDEWKLCFYFKTNDSSKVEEAIHSCLYKDRIYPNREFFRSEPDKIRELFKGLLEGGFIDGKIVENIPAKEEDHQFGGWLSYEPYTPESPSEKHIEISEFFAKIYPDKELYKYVLRMFSSCLDSKKENQFSIMSGSGRNGKNTVLKLLAAALGSSHVGFLASKDLTRKDALPKKTQTLLMRRALIIPEPEEGHRINNDHLQQFTTSAPCFMACNDLPSPSRYDTILEQLRVVPHVATFVEEDKPMNPAANIHPRDPHLDDSKINTWAPYFAGMLVWYYENQYRFDGVDPEPIQVTRATECYIEEYDVFRSFSKEYLVKEKGAETRLTDVCARYSEWRRYNPGKNRLTDVDLNNNMIKYYGSPIEGKTFGGVRILMEDEEYMDDNTGSSAALVINTRTA
jgi:hypothetical protein